MVYGLLVKSKMVCKMFVSKSQRCPRFYVLPKKGDANVKDDVKNVHVQKATELILK